MNAHLGYWFIGVMDFRIAIKSSIYITIGLLFIIVSALYCETACAELLTYKDIIRDAVDNSARIRVRVEDINVTDVTYRQNFAGLYPEITANSRFERYENLDKRSDRGVNLISGEIVGGDESSWKSSIYLWGQYYISHWYKKRLEANYYEKLVDARIYDCDTEVKRLLKELTDAYSALAEGKIKIKYGSEILMRMQEILNLKKRIFSDGQVSYADVLKAEADVASVEKEIAAVRKEFKENLERICSYTAKTYDENIEVEKLVSDGNIRLTDFQQHIGETPEYKARMKELEAAKYKLKAAENNFWPDISIYGRYDYYGNNIYGIDKATKDMRETAYYAGLLITLPIFDGGVRKWERKKNMFEMRKQQETLNAVVEEKGRDIKTLSAGYQEVSKAIKHYRKLNDQYARMLDITKKSYPLGEKSMLDIMEMEKEALGVERDLKVMEHAMAVYEKRLLLETDYKNFIMEYYGNRACKY